MIPNPEIQALVESKLCPVHYEHPELKIMNDELYIHCCCDEFKRKCIIEIQLTFKDRKQEYYDNRKKNNFVRR